MGISPTNKFLFHFLSFLHKNLVKQCKKPGKLYFDQYLEHTEPKCWSKYTTIGCALGRMSFIKRDNENELIWGINQMWFFNLKVASQQKYEKYSCEIGIKKYLLRKITLRN